MLVKINPPPPKKKTINTSFMGTRTSTLKNVSELQSCKNFITVEEVAFCDFGSHGMPY